VRKATAPQWGTEAVHDSRKAHRSVEHMQGKKTWQLEGLLGSLSATAPQRVLTGHHLAPVERFPTASTEDDLFVLLNGQNSRGKETGKGLHR